LSTNFINFLKRYWSSIKFKYDINREQWLKERNLEKQDVLWVHEIFRCQLKNRFEGQFPMLADGLWLHSPIILGELIDIAVKDLAGSINDKIVSKEIFIDDRMLTIAGMPDILDEKTRTVIEVKYAGGAIKEPLQHHVLQVKTYKWITGYLNAELWYFTRNGCSSFPVEYPITEDELVSAVKGNGVPAFPEWECRYCIYKTLCPGVGEGK